jgi:hypothetical protein
MAEVSEISSGDISVKTPGLRAGIVGDQQSFRTCMRLDAFQAFPDAEDECSG